MHQGKYEEEKRKRVRREERRVFIGGSWMGDLKSLGGVGHVGFEVFGFLVELEGVG